MHLEKPKRLIIWNGGSDDQFVWENKKWAVLLSIMIRMWVSSRDDNKLVTMLMIFIPLVEVLCFPQCGYLTVAWKMFTFTLFQEVAYCICLLKLMLAWATHPIHVDIHHVLCMPWQHKWCSPGRNEEGLYDWAREQGDEPISKMHCTMCITFSLLVRVLLPLIDTIHGQCCKHWFCPMHNLILVLVSNVSVSVSVEYAIQVVFFCCNFHPK
jgi:hypothetical protein